MVAQVVAAGRAARAARALTVIVEHPPRCARRFETVRDFKERYDEPSSEAALVQGLHRIKGVKGKTFDEAGVIDDVDSDKSLRHVGSIIGRCLTIDRGSGRRTGPVGS